MLAMIQTSYYCIIYVIFMHVFISGEMVKIDKVKNYKYVGRTVFEAFSREEVLPDFNLILTLFEISANIKMLPVLSLTKAVKSLGASLWCIRYNIM
jgi:hypothetical protein